MTGKRFPDPNNKHALPVDFDWQLVIRDLGLNQEGELFLSYFSAKIEAQMKARAARRRSTHKTPNLGAIGAREVAIALLACCWTGEIPDDFPMLVSLADVQKEEMTAEVWND
jgi:hypothetical protein